MSLPYTTPPSSHPGTPLTASRPGTPSKVSRSLTSLVQQIIQDDSNGAVLEKQGLSTARSSGLPKPYPLPRALRPLSPFVRLVAVPIPKTDKSLVLPVPLLFVHNDRQKPLSPLRAKDSRHPTSKRYSSWPRTRPTPLGYVVIVILLLIFFPKIRRHSRRISIPFVPTSTSILTTEQIARVWEWEISRGHYPSSRRTPVAINLAGLRNPGVDASSWGSAPTTFDARTRALPAGPNRFPAGFSAYEAVHPSGPKRHYLNITNTQRRSSDLSARDAAVFSATFPPRPVPNSILDLDVVMEHCDFTTNRYVRDCLEVLRVGATMDNQHRVRRGRLDRWKQTYLEEGTREEASSTSALNSLTVDGKDIMEGLGYRQKDPHGLTPAEARAFQTDYSSSGLSAAQIAQNLKAPDLRLRQSIVGFGANAKPHPTHPTADPMCDPDYPHIFHIFWAGPFTDKPYLAVMSFLFTQNLGLYLQKSSKEQHEFLKQVCRPQLWIWINPGPAASLPNPRARSQMFDSLRDNPWSAPFLDDRFSEAIKFRMWNTTEQLDAIPELRHHWRSLPLFNSGGVKFGSQQQQPPPEDNEEEDITNETPNPTAEKEEEELGRFGEEAAGQSAKDLEDALTVKGENLKATAAPTGKRPSGVTSVPKPKGKKGQMLERVGSTSSKEYDRLTVVLSDMARFVLTHRFGGVYLDADTLLLRDWEELFGWKGAFAYRWSRLEKYNTAVLKMQRNSAIGSFLFKSALANGLDFHPMTISKYTRDANLEALLLRLPDALFDSAWLNTEYYQRDRPPYPYFKRFEDFFDPPKEDSAAPLALGYEGFFRGAFSYHFHNFWWIPFDPSRNWPDLGERFAKGERKAREAARQAKLAAEQQEGTMALLLEKGGVAQRTAEPTAGRPDRTSQLTSYHEDDSSLRIDDDDVKDDTRDLGWATVLKRTFEAYIREERPNMYGEWIKF